MTKTTFFNFTLFDGTNDQNQPDAWFTVDNASGKLVDRGQGTPAAADTRVDLQGQYVMPGFMNVHVHITADTQALQGKEHSEAEAGVLAFTNLQALLKSGVTYVRGCGTGYDADVKLKKLQRAGQLPHTPHMLTSGKAFSMTGGHGDSPHGGHAVDSPDEMRKAVRTAFKNGAESIKVMATGGVMTPNDFMEDAQLSVAKCTLPWKRPTTNGALSLPTPRGTPVSRMPSMPASTPWNTASTSPKPRRSRWSNREPSSPPR